MKNLLIVLSVLFSGLLLSQKIDINNLDKEKLETKIFKQINSYRKKIGIDTLAFSSVTKKYISRVNVKQMYDLDLLFHPEYSTTNPVFVSELFNEYSKIFKGKIVAGENNYPFISEAGEIVISLSCTTNDCMTYDEFAKKCLDGWLSSPGHKAIIHSSFKNFQQLPGVGSCALEVKNGTFYIAFNFFAFIPVF